jgi:hypothetical protein
MSSIDEFKSNLIGGGARANQYRVIMTTPPAITTGLDINRASFLCKATSLPGQTIGEVPVAFRGRTLYLAGDREFETWTTTVINDTDFMVRNAMERWMNGINDLDENTGLVNVSDYTAQITVEQLDRDNNILKQYILKNVWPTAVTAIELSYDTANEIETFDVTWRYTSFTPSAV